MDDLRLFKLERKLQQPDMVRRYHDEAVRLCVCGGSQLKESQSYPVGFLGPCAFV